MLLHCERRRGSFSKKGPTPLCLRCLWAVLRPLWIDSNKRTPTVNGASARSNARRWVMSAGWSKLGLYRPTWSREDDATITGILSSWRVCLQHGGRCMLDSKETSWFTDILWAVPRSQANNTNDSALTLIVFMNSSVVISDKWFRVAIPAWLSIAMNANRWGMGGFTNVSKEDV